MNKSVHIFAGICSVLLILFLLKMKTNILGMYDENSRV